MTHKNSLSWDTYNLWLGDVLIRTQPGSAPPTPSHLVTDSRRFGPGKWFLALEGETFDGHAFISQVVERGAAGVICSAKAEHLVRDIPAIVVRDTKLALNRIAAGWRHFVNPKTIAITGSCGKTTTKDLLCEVLSLVGSTVGTNGNENNEIGVPLTLLRTTPETKFLVVEMGARKPGDIAYLMGIADPDISVCLNIGKAHIEIFGNQKNLIDTKLQIFSESRPNTLCVGNLDDPNIAKFLQNSTKAKATFGFSKESTIQIEASSVTELGRSVSIGGKNFIFSNLHEALPLNMAAVLCVTRFLTVSDVHAINVARNYNGSAGRFSKKVVKNGFLIDDSYNANPESMKSGLKSLASMTNSTKSIALILGDMLELGAESQKFHTDLGHFVAMYLSHAKVFFVGRFAREFQKGFDSVPGHRDHELFSSFPTAEDLIQFWKADNFEFDVIYLKASHGIHLEKVVEYLTS